MQKKEYMTDGGKKFLWGVVAGLAEERKIEEIKL